jgi:WXG100 family type VII secretion target
MAGFTVDLAALLAAVDQMSTFNSDLEQHLAQVKASAALLGPSWHGEASDRQEAAQDQWNNGAEELRRSWPAARHRGAGARQLLRRSDDEHANVVVEAACHR